MLYLHMDPDLELQNSMMGKLLKFPVITSEADQSGGCRQRGVLVDIQTNFMDIVYFNE